MNNEDFIAILEAARLGLYVEEVKEDMDISDSEAQRLHTWILETLKSFV